MVREQEVTTKCQGLARLMLRGVCRNKKEVNRLEDCRLLRRRKRERLRLPEAKKIASGTWLKVNVDWPCCQERSGCLTLKVSGRCRDAQHVSATTPQRSA